MILKLKYIVFTMLVSILLIELICSDVDAAIIKMVDPDGSSYYFDTEKDYCVRLFFKVIKKVNNSSNDITVISRNPSDTFVRGHMWEHGGLGDPVGGIFMYPTVDKYYWYEIVLQDADGFSVVPSVTIPPGGIYYSIIVERRVYNPAPQDPYFGLPIGWSYYGHRLFKADFTSPPSGKIALADAIESYIDGQQPSPGEPASAPYWPFGCVSAPIIPSNTPNPDPGKPECSNGVSLK